MVDDADIIDRGHVQNENWLSHSSKDGALWVSDVSFRAGDNEIEFLAAHFGVAGESVTDLVQPQIKHRFVEAGDASPFGIAVAAGVNFYVDRPGVGPYVYVPVTVPIGKNLDTSFDLGLLDPPGPGAVQVTWGTGAEYALSGAYTLVGEVFGNGGETGFQFGPRRSWGDDLVLDLIYGRNVLGTDETLLTAGLTFVF